ncbi:MAG: molybdopterin cofactor-binding domain-containing protein, partial [Gammaproteobacteria bacterium]
LLGRPLPRLDVPAKTDGSALFGCDVRNAGTVYASIRIAPVFGGRLERFDRAALEARAGVIGVIPLDDALAVVARTWWHAERALAAAEITFSPGPGAATSSADLFARYAAALDEDDGFAYEDDGDARAALAGADVLRAEYRAPLLAHACMEPMNCTVRLGNDSAEIWCGNQAPDLLRMIAADLLELEPAQVTLHTPFLGGGFGRRAESDFMRYAIAIAQAVPDQTVQLLYSREQDLQHDTYRPPVLSRFAARLDDNGRIAAWHNRIAGPSVSHATIARVFPDLPLGGPDKTSAEGAAHLAYAVPARLVEHTQVDIPVPVGFWRSVGHSYNAFFTECFIDELAAAAGVDALAFRLDHLAGRPRERAVLALLADACGWNDDLPAGRARGLALHESFHSIVGQVAEVSVANGQVVVHRVVCVIDCGEVVNPDIVIAQMESGIVFGLTAALYGDVRLEDGRVAQRNFPDYRMLTLKDMPRIETHVIASGAEPGGVGEPGTPPIAPAVTNALSRLLGRRIRSLPLNAALNA